MMIGTNDQFAATATGMGLNGFVFGRRASALRWSKLSQHPQLMLHKTIKHLKNDKNNSNALVARPSATTLMSMVDIFFRRRAVR